MNESTFRLDRTKFKAQSFKEAAHQLNYWKDKSDEEKLKALNYLNSVAYNFDPKKPPRLNRTIFSMRKHLF